MKKYLRKCALYDTLLFVKENRNHIALRRNLHIKVLFGLFATDSTFTDNRAGNWRAGNCGGLFPACIITEESNRSGKPMSVRLFC